MTDKIAVFISHIGEEAALAHSLKSWIESTFPDQVTVFVSSDLVTIEAGDEWYDKIMKSFRTAAVTLAGVELAHRIRKSQFTFGSRGPHQFSSLKHAWARALMCSDDVLTVRESARRVTFGRDCTRTHQRVSAC